MPPATLERTEDVAPLKYDGKDGEIVVLTKLKLAKIATLLNVMLDPPHHLQLKHVVKER